MSVALISVIWWVAGLMTSAIAIVASSLLRAIDSQRVLVYDALVRASEEPNELDQQNMELRLLTSASSIRDHAQEIDDWTDKHTEALNAIGEALVIQAGWEIDDVNRYLKEVVESIDGLELDIDEW